MKMENVIYCGDNLVRLQAMPDGFVDLVYADPPFFSNRHYEVIWNDGAEIRSFEDRWRGGIHHYVEWMKDRCFEIHRVLRKTGSMYLHCDWHASHYLKTMLDEVFGAANFQNEIVWYYGAGGRSRKRFGRKHDVLLFYSKGKKWTFNDRDIRVPMKAGKTSFGGRLRKDENGRVYREVWGTGRKKIYRYYLDEGKVPEDVWEIPSIQSRDRERLGYPTQKPESLLERVVLASSNEGDLVLDPFCGCGTSIAVAERLGRRWVGIDVSPTACKLMKRRLDAIGAKGVRITGLPMSIDGLKDLDPFEFQNWIVGAMEGAPSARKVRDMGIDGYTYFDRQPIQVKQSEHVGRPVVDDFETAMRRYYANALRAAEERKERAFTMKGIIVAFSFTRGAHEEVARAKGEGIEIDLLRVEDVVKGFEE